MSKQVKKNNTDLKFSEIKKKAKLSHIKEKYELEDGSTVTFYPTFPPSIVDEMMKEMQASLQTQDEELFMDYDLMMKYTVFHCIKYFTHLKSQLKSITYEEKLLEMTSILDHEINGVSLFNIIADEIFDQKEIYKVFDLWAKHTGNFMFMQSLESKAHEQLEKLEIKNRDVFENLNFNKTENRKQIPEV